MEMELPYTLADRYRLVSHLAKGGMSDVFLGVDLALGRRVAVKILPRSHSEDESFVRRFRREAQSAANLNHPNIVGIYDWGEAEGAYFMVMELVEGDCLSDITKEGLALPVHRAVEIAREVVLALAVAHRLGLVHRDVKPGNVMLTADGMVKVADFGIARAWNRSTELTQTGSVIGTATYFSPEQAQGRPADIRSDIYSLGVVLYEMLAGRPPFRGESPMSVAYQHVSAEVAPPSSHNSDVPPELDAIVLRALSKDPERRYQDTEPLLQDLEAWLRGEQPPGPAAEPKAVAAQPPPGRSQVMVRQPIPSPAPRRTGGRGGRLLSQNYYPHLEERRPTPLPFVMGVLVLLAALAGLSWVVWNLLQAPAPQPEAVTVAIPEVVGRWETDALASIQESGLIVQVLRESSQEMPEGRVISTDPPAGERVESRTEVVVVVSSGLERFDVPLVIGQTQGTAESLILAQGFLVGGIEFIEDSGRQVGTVVDQNPLPGPLLPAGTPIDLIVATGPGLVVVPDVVGLPGSEALSVLAQLGMRWAETIESSDTVPVGQVIRTEPGAGGGIPATGQVVVVMSGGPETPEPGLDTVPSLAGLPIGEALVILAQSGLRWTEVAELSDTVPPGQVIRTEPVAGETLEGGAEVVVVVSQEAEEVPELLVIPDVRGLTIDEAQAMLAEAGLSATVLMEFSDFVSLGLVIRSEPEGGQSVAASVPVVLFVSGDPAQNSTTTTVAVEETTTTVPSGETTTTTAPEPTTTTQPQS